MKDYNKSLNSNLEGYMKLLNSISQSMLNLFCVHMDIFIKYWPLHSHIPN